MTVVGIVSWRTSHKTEQRHKLTMDSSHFEIDVVTPVFSLWPKFARSKIPSRIPFALPIHGWVEGRWTYVWFSLRKFKKKRLGAKQGTLIRRLGLSNCLCAKNTWQNSTIFKKKCINWLKNGHFSRIKQIICCLEIFTISFYLLNLFDAIL